MSGSPVSAALSVPPPPAASAAVAEARLPAPLTATPSAAARRRNAPRSRWPQTYWRASASARSSWCMVARPLLRLPAQEVDDGLVERVGVLPQARVPARRGGPLRPADGLVQAAGEAHRDEDVLLPGEHQRR